QVVNGYQWNGTQWVPSAQAQNAPQVGQEVNGHRWDGTQWVPLAQAAAPAAGPAAPIADGAAAAGESALTGQLKELSDSLQLTWSQKRDVTTVEKVIAQRTAFMATAKLEYQAKIRINDASREVAFRELLKETGAGMSGGDDSDGIGFGFQGGSYHSGGGMADDIAEQAGRYGKLYSFDFDYAAWRDQVKALVEAAGYQFKYGAK
ncbi:MAG: hypothetical protein KJ777_09785, partial [Actinobacteria bacterium]|nr:hypothetical protein [Actinomycetota bacterium]